MEGIKIRERAGRSMVDRHLGMVEWLKPHKLRVQIPAGPFLFGSEL